MYIRTTRGNSMLAHNVHKLAVAVNMTKGCLQKGPSLLLVEATTCAPQFSMTEANLHVQTPTLRQNGNLKLPSNSYWNILV